jgi:hypothetical protein
MEAEASSAGEETSATSKPARTMAFLRDGGGKGGGGGGDR